MSRTTVTTIPPEGMFRTMADDPVLPRTDPTGSPPPVVPRGYTATKDQLQKRLARIEGQVRGVSKMVEEDRYCVDVLTQINAVRAALDKVALGLLDGHARHCLLGHGGGPTEPEEQVQELMTAVGRMLQR